MHEKKDTGPQGSKGISREGIALLGWDIPGIHRHRTSGLQALGIEEESRTWMRLRRPAGREAMGCNSLVHYLEVEHFRCAERRRDLYMNRSRRGARR